jgi:polysaccharide biosynthesis protein PslG
MNGSAARRKLNTLALMASAVLCLGLIVDTLGSVPGSFFAASSDGRVSAEPQRTIPNTDLNPYGANFFLEWEPEAWKIDKTYQLAREAGIGWVKQQFPWEDIQLSPGKDGFWDDRLNQSTWDKYDRIVDLARKNNLEIIARLDRPPKWSRQDNSVAQAPPDRFEDYGDFVYAFVSHFKGRIKYYQIWNEPNVFPEWGNQAPSPEEYVRLLRIAATRAREADPNVWILSAPLAQTLERSDKNLSDLEYLERMYAAGAKDYFDVLFANAYGFAFPPDDPPSPDRLNFSRVTLQRQIMERNGDGAKPVWFNEFGWNAAPADFPADKLPWARVSEQQQAAYTVQAIQLARANWPWAGVFNVWYFRQAGNIQPDRPEYYFRMVDPGFTTRPLYQAIRKASTDIGVAGPGVHEETDPAATFSGAWQVERNANASAGAVIHDQKPGDSLTITFQGTEVALLSMIGPGTGTLNVTVDGREANRLPRDRQGRSYLDLSTVSGAGTEWVPVADNLRDERHVVRLVVAQPPTDGRSDVSIDGFRVAENTTAPADLWLRGAGVLVALVAVVVFAKRAIRR